MLRVAGVLGSGTTRFRVHHWSDEATWQRVAGRGKQTLESWLGKGGVERDQRENTKTSIILSTHMQNHKQFLGYSNDLRLSFGLRHASFPNRNSDTSHLSANSVAAPRA